MSMEYLITTQLNGVLRTLIYRSCLLPDKPNKVKKWPNQLRHSSKIVSLRDKYTEESIIYYTSERKTRKSYSSIYKKVTNRISKTL